MAKKEKLDKLFENKDRSICSICGKPSLPNFYGACCDKHRKMSCKILMGNVKKAVKNLPIVKLHF